MADIFRRREQRLPKPEVQVAPEPAPAARRLEHLASTRDSRAPDASEILRIATLPLWLPPAPEEVEAFNRDCLLAEAYDKGFRLFPAQVAAAMAYDLFDGGFLPIGVGFGKTLISLMVAQRAFLKGIETTVLMVPPQVYPQLTEFDIPWARRRIPLSVPFFGLGRKPQKKRAMIARARQKGCYIVPYSLLSTPDSEEMLSRIEPGLLILDEAHNLKNASAARTRRVRRYLESQPDVEMVAMSGTITSKSIVDYWHLIRASLKDNSPLPKSMHLVRHWAQVLDAQQGNDAFGGAREADAYAVGDFSVEPIMPLVYWARKKFPEERFPETIRGFRAAYRKRLETAPGVVVTGDASIGTSLTFRNDPAYTGRLIDVPNGGAELQQFIDGVQKDWQTPGGDEIDYAIHCWGWLYQLTAGFYSDLYWPDPEKLVADAAGRGETLTLADADERLERAQEHHALLQLYHSELRRWLAHRQRPGLDTPFLVGSDMLRHGAKNVGEELYQSWQDVRAADFPERPERLSRPVRVCDYKVRAAVAWASSLPKKHPGGILWVHHQEIGRWVYEALHAAGLDVLHCPAGGQHDRVVVDPDNRNRLLVCSITAHGTGKNLQHFRNQLFVQWPRSAVIAEQAVGRTHRTGQLADELVVHRMDSTHVDRATFGACVNDSVYIHSTTGVRQKLMVGSYDPAPVVFDPGALRSMGLDNRRLTGEQIDLLREKFGSLSNTVS